MSASSQDSQNKTALADDLQRVQEVPRRNSYVIMIHNSKVGLVIGKGGGTIKRLQRKSGAELRIIDDDSNTSHETPLLVSGDPTQLEIAKNLIEDVIGEKKCEKEHACVKSISIEVLVPEMAVGLVIGKGGVMIKKIQSETGAQLQFRQPRNAVPGDQRCYVSGTHINVGHARHRIEQIIDTVRSRRNCNVDGTEFIFTVPASKCGLLIGNGGETIRSIMKYSGVHCEMNRSYRGENRVFIIRGGEHQIPVAQKMISQKIDMVIELVPMSASNNAGAYPPQNWSVPFEQHQQ